MTISCHFQTEKQYDSGFLNAGRWTAKYINVRIWIQDSTIGDVNFYVRSVILCRAIWST